MFEPSAADLRSHVNRLAAMPRPARSPAHRQAAACIQEHLERAGFTVERDAFGDGGVNLLTRPLPDQADLPLVIIGAHYDSLPGTPGADDNASAVAALLELAAWVGPHTSPRWAGAPLKRGCCSPPTIRRRTAFSAATITADKSTRPSRE